MIKRIFLLVLDSLGIGALPDCGDFGDPDSVHTLHHVCAHPDCHIPTLLSLGLGQIPGVSLPACAKPLAAHGRMCERSAGKDTVIGHWEISGAVSTRPLPTYPQGFPGDVMARIEEATGISAICNRPYSGTEVLKDYGEEMMRTGKVIVYTSADSVFQVAAHEEVMPREALYAYCEQARAILTGEHGVGRVIARPFVGSGAQGFTRTAGRHDYALSAPSATVLDLVAESGKQVVCVGKIADIFNRRGVTAHHPTTSNAHGMAVTAELAKSDFEGLCFVNLVDFDMKYGHRRDVEGYARALTEFDTWLSGFLPTLSDSDALILTADHGCDPTAPGTDHTREAVPLLIYGKTLRPVPLGILDCFGDVGASICGLLGIDPSPLSGTDHSLLLETGCTPEMLLSAAKEAMARAYCPYSGFYVGAALLTGDGTIYTGCNIENAAFSPTVCAERVAIFKAVSEGERDFRALAVLGGRAGEIADFTYPCGVCRQVLSEFCPPSMPVLTENRSGEHRSLPLSALLPNSFNARAFQD